MASASKSNLDIREDDLGGVQVGALLREHLESVVLHSPPESVHALDVEGLRAPDVTFWAAWDGETLAGVGALKELDAAHGEIKSMRTARTHLRRGVASAIVEHLLGVARERGYTRLSLETGSADAFTPARSLYRRHGFEVCAPFGSYRLDPYSVFMTLELEPGRRTGSPG